MRIRSVGACKENKVFAVGHNPGPAMGGVLCFVGYGCRFSGFEIVETYSDLAKSGLDIKRRPGLRTLIDEVTKRLVTPV
jgi:hypothetical protein